MSKCHQIVGFIKHPKTNHFSNTHLSRGMFLFSLGLLLLATMAVPSTAEARHRNRQRNRSFHKTIKVSCSRGEGAWLSLPRFRALRFRARQRSVLGWSRLGEAHYEAKQTKKGLEIKATIQIESSGKSWHQVSVLPLEYPIFSATLDGKPAWLIPSSYRGGYRRLVFEGAGRRVLKIRFFLPLLPGPDPRVKLKLALASAGHLTVTFPGKGFRPKLSSGLAIKVEQKATQTILRASLLPRSFPILSWWQATNEQGTKKKMQKRSARLYAKTYALLSVGQGGQELFVTVRYTIVHAPREQFRLKIPKGIHIRQVHGLGIRDYRMVKDKKGREILDVLLTEPVTERYELSLLTESRKDTGQIALRLPAPIGVQRETGYLGIEVIGNDALKVKPVGATTIDVQELPPEIIRGTQRPILRAYRFTKRPATWRLEVHRHKNVSVPAAIIDQALYLQVANHRGHVWIQASYQVRNTFKQFVAIQLPPKAELQSAFVGGQPVKPAKDPKGRVLVPLKRSGKTGGYAFSVEIVYSLNESFYTGRSFHKALLPSVDLWISSLQWRLYLPEGKINWLRKEFGRERVRGYANWDSQRMRGKTGRIYQRTTNQKFRSVVKNKKILLGGQSSGILPVRIHLPRRGRYYSFHRYHLGPEAKTSLSFSHQTPYFGTLGLAFFLFGGFLFGLALTFMTLKKRWNALSFWLMVVVSALCVYLGFYFSTIIHATLTTTGALCGVILAALLHFFLNWGKNIVPRSDAKEPSPSKE